MDQTEMRGRPLLGRADPKAGGDAPESLQVAKDCSRGSNQSAHPTPIAQLAHQQNRSCTRVLRSRLC